MSRIANARMYSVTESAAADWKALLSWVLKRANLEFELLDYPAPAPVSVLWARNDLGLTLMCGLPFAQREARPVLIAHPVPRRLARQGAPDAGKLDRQERRRALCLHSRREGR